MLRNILTGIVGKKLASGNPTAGALIGAAAPMIAKRGLGPLGLAVGGAWLAKKAYEKRQTRQRVRPQPSVG